ncbi:MAG: hypothetical protein KDK72_07685 [Chlamydiia bacterium]|nr:hypothetical protein [Chlamydiia bacterium]
MASLTTFTDLDTAGLGSIFGYNASNYEKFLLTEAEKNSCKPLKDLKGRTKEHIEKRINLLALCAIMTCEKRYLDDAKALDEKLSHDDEKNNEYLSNAQLVIERHQDWKDKVAHQEHGEKVSLYDVNELFMNCLYPEKKVLSSCLKLNLLPKQAGSVPCLSTRSCPPPKTVRFQENDVVFRARSVDAIQGQELSLENQAKRVYYLNLLKYRDKRVVFESSKFFNITVTRQALSGRNRNAIECTISLVEEAIKSRYRYEQRRNKYYHHLKEMKQHEGSFQEFYNSLPTEMRFSEQIQKVEYWNRKKK